MKRYSFILIPFVFLACIHSEDPPITEEDHAPIQTSEKNICEINLSDKEGELELHRKWEFAGFQNIISGQMDHLTCLARVADFALKGEDYENLFKVVLEFSQDLSSMEGCNDSTEYKATSFGLKIQGCYSIDSDNLNLIIPQSGINYVPGPASNTFPVLHFDDAFLNGLKSVKNYRIEKDKLYLYDDLEEERMVFVALDE